MIPILAALVLAGPDRLDLLPRFRDSVFVGSVSSYRTGGNDDGFSGTYSFVRRDERGLVLHLDTLFKLFYIFVELTPVL